MTWGDINNGDVGPGMFSWFHLLWLGIMIAGCIVLGLTVAKKHSPKCDWIVIAVFSLILVCYIVLFSLLALLVWGVSKLVRMARARKKA